MAIGQVFHPYIRSVVLLSYIVLLTACGGGGSGGSKDSTPSAFAFAALSNAAVSTDVISSPITVAGTDTETAISITGGTYSINDAAFTAASGMVSAGQTVKIKLTTPATTNTSTTAALTIGGVAGTFTVTTLADVTPNAFNFTAKTDVAPSSENISDTVILAGFDIPVSITISGGEYKIDNGPYTSAAGTVSAGQSINVKTTASASVSTAVSAQVTIGGVSGIYSVTTFPDTVAPTAQVMFPTPVSLSTGATLKVRGTASDAHSTITGITVAGVAAESTAVAPAKAFSTWTAEVPLALGANTLNIATADSAGATKSDAATINVQRVSTLATAQIPDALNPLSTPLDMTFDSENNRIFIVDENGLFSVDLHTGGRSRVSGATDTLYPLSVPYGIDLDTANNKLYVVDESSSAVVAVNLTEGADKGRRTIVSDCRSADSTIDIDHPNDLMYDAANNRVLVADFGHLSITAIDVLSGKCTSLSDASTTADPNLELVFPDDIKKGIDNNQLLVVDSSRKAIFDVNALTGARSLLSSNLSHTGANFFQPTGIAVDVTNKRILVADVNKTLLSVDATTGARRVISNTTTPNANTTFSWPIKVILHPTRDVAMVLDQSIKAVFVVDLFSGERVIISK